MKWNVKLLRTIKIFCLSPSTGYMLLAGRCRKSEEAVVIQETIERTMKRKIDLDSLFKTGSLTTTNILQQVSSTYEILLCPRISPSGFMVPGFHQVFIK